MKIVLIGKFPYPQGYGLSIFCGNLAAGLSQLGCTVRVFIIWPTESGGRAVNKEASGKNGNVEFRYTCGRTDYPSPGRMLFLYKAWFWIYGIFALWSHLRKEDRGPEKIDTLLVTSISSYIWIVKLYALLFGKTMVCYHGEYPACGQKVPWYRLPVFWVEKHFSHLLADGMIVATGVLADYYGKYTRKDCLFCRIPILLKTEDFPEPDGNVGNVLTYCGDMSNSKDGVDFLLRVFGRVAPMFPDFRLQMIGSAPQCVMENLRKICEEENIADRVVFTGVLPHRQVIAALQKSAVLILTRPANRQAEGGFPSKLGEYLYTGNPVLVSAVGELPRILTDRENVFFARPGDMEDFAEKLKGILSDLPSARETGRRGRQFASENFNCRHQCEKILAFCKTVEQNRRGNINV